MLKELIAKYWIVYYIVYVVAVVAAVALQWGKLLTDNDPTFRLAAIFGLSAGLASFLAIVSEVFGRMVLLIPEAVRKLREEGRVKVGRKVGRKVVEGRVKGREEGRVEGRVEGREEGRVEGQVEERSRVEAAIEDLGDSLPPDVIDKLKERLLNPSSDKRK